MSNIFASVPGTIKVIKDGIGVGSVRFPQLLNSNDEKIIITGIQYSQDANVQFMQTLSDEIYVYSFGDKIGTIIINGFTFARNCNNVQTSYFTLDRGSGVTNNTHGVNLLLKFYQDNKVSNITNPAIRIAIGTETIEGFLIGIRINKTDKDFELYSFSLIIAAMPKGARINTANAATSNNVI